MGTREQIKIYSHTDIFKFGFVPIRKRFDYGHTMSFFRPLYVVCYQKNRNPAV